MDKNISTARNSQKRKIRGLSVFQREKAFNTINYVPYDRVHPNKRGIKNNNLNKCLQFIEVRSWERGGDCVFKNKELAKLLGVTFGQVKKYIAKLEKTGFISCLYKDIPREEKILNDQNIEITRKYRPRTFRIMRCHRVIAAKGYQTPSPKVDPNCRKNKPFRNDFRPDLDQINFNKIPLKVFQQSRIGSPAERNAEKLRAFGVKKDARMAASLYCSKKLIGIEEGEKRGIIPLFDQEKDGIVLESSFLNLFEEYANINKSPYEPVWDKTVKDMYISYKIKQELGDATGEAILGKHYYINKDIEALPDHKVMYFKPTESSSARGQYQKNRDADLEAAHREYEHSVIEYYRRVNPKK
jgi:hypothetical protein